MTVYILIIIFISLLSLKYDFRKSTNAKAMWGYIILVVFILLAGFRGDIGNDTMVYHRWYDSLSNNPLYEIKNSRFEPLFVLCSTLLKNIGCSWLIVQILLATWINYTIYTFIRRYTSLIFLPLLLYFLSVFYFLNCEEIRAAVAFGFVLIALPYLEKEKYLNYLIMVVVGCGFHYSNALFLLLPLVPNIFKNKLFLAIVLSVCFVVVNIIQTKFGMYAMVIDSFLGIDTVSSYADGDYIDASSKSLMNLINIFAVGVFFPLLAYFISQNTNVSLQKIFFIYVFCIIGSMALPLFYRYNHQLAIVEAVVLCKALDNAYRSHKIIPKLIIVMCLAISIYGSISNYLTYNSFLDGYFYENFIPYTLYDF